MLNAEFYPLWARGTCVSISTAVNWIFNLIISLTFLSLTQAITKYGNYLYLTANISVSLGTFFLYFGITCVALVFVIFFVPETKNCAIEEVELLFMRGEQRRKKGAELHKRHGDIAPGLAELKENPALQY